MQSISISYTKQNAGGELTWRPWREWNIGAAYGFERYDWVRADANATNENSGKVYVDWQPTRWITARASVLAASRRYETYDYLGFVGAAQWPNGGAAFGITRYSTAYRQFMFDNRDRVKAQASVAVDLLRNLTLTPIVAVRDDDYRLNPATEVGLQFDRTTSAGVELVWVASPYTRFLVSYMHDLQKQSISSAGQQRAAVPRQSILYRASRRYREHLSRGRHPRGDSERARRDAELHLRHAPTIRNR